MRAVIVYHTERDYERDVIGYLKEFEYRTHDELQRIDPDTRDGDSFCRTYDVTEYPAILVLDNEGKVITMWQGMPLPLIDEVRFYVQ